MNALGFRPSLRAKLSWLLWLALLLPMAQSVASWHALSHVAVEAEATDDSSRAVLHGLHCDLCLAAAAVGSGAAPMAHAAPALVAARYLRPLTASVVERPAQPTLAYQSRAPPFVPV